jgi:hypothetical protein
MASNLVESLEEVRRAAKADRRGTCPNEISIPQLELSVVDFYYGARISFRCGGT